MSTQLPEPKILTPVPTKIDRTQNQNKPKKRVKIYQS